MKNNMENILQVSKLDAAKRQIETAIRLYFSSGDPVSIHTLIAASYNVLNGISKKRGGDKLLMKDVFAGIIQEGREENVWKLINKAENFFKHADRDHDETIEFNPLQSEFLFYESCLVYEKLTGELPPLFKLYQYWFIANHLSLFKLSLELEQTMGMGAKEILNLGKEQYFNTMLPLLYRINI